MIKLLEYGRKKYIFTSFACFGLSAIGFAMAKFYVYCIPKNN